MTDLLAATQTNDDDPGFVQLLFQLHRPSGRTRVLFERQNPVRWKVDPSDWNALPEAIRPNFE